MKDGPTPNSQVPKKHSEWDATKKLAIQNNAKVKKILICGIGPDKYNRVSLCQDAMAIWDTLQVAHEGNTQVERLRLTISTNSMISSECTIGNLYRTCKPNSLL